MDPRRRWSDGGEVGNGRVVPIEALSGAEPGIERDNTRQDDPGRSVHRSLEPVASSTSPDERDLRPDAVTSSLAEDLRRARPRPPVQARATESGPRQEPSELPTPPLPFSAIPARPARQEWCAIVFAGAKCQGEFHAVVIDHGGQRRVVAHSPRFRASRSGRVSRRGGAKDAHELLVRRLLILGWRPVPSRGRWHDTAFTRAAPSDDRPVERLLITCRHDRLAARFQAARFDEQGTPTVVAESEAFLPLRGLGSTKLGHGAASAHRELLERLQRDGWQTTEDSGAEWSADVLERPVGLRPVQ
jgi:hypothetical protein